LSCSSAFSAAIPGDAACRADLAAFRCIFPYNFEKQGQ
jgi:hypothetical protein